MHHHTKLVSLLCCNVTACLCPLQTTTPALLLTPELSARCPIGLGGTHVWVHTGECITARAVCEKPATLCPALLRLHMLGTEPWLPSDIPSQDQPLPHQTFPVQFSPRPKLPPFWATQMGLKEDSESQPSELGACLCKVVAHQRHLICVGSACFSGGRVSQTPSPGAAQVPLSSPSPHTSD